MMVLTETLTTVFAEFWLPVAAVVFVCINVIASFDTENFEDYFNTKDKG
jgi:hypothetical protein